MVKSFKMRTDGFGWGPVPEPEDVVEQRFSLSEAGRITITTFKFADGDRYRMVSRRSHVLDPDKLAEVRTLLGKAFNADAEFPHATDVGVWSATLENTEGEIFECSGSVGWDVNEVTMAIRNLLNDNDVWLTIGPNEKRRCGSSNRPA